MERLDPADLDRAFDLARLPAQTLVIRFGPREDVIVGRYPIITVNFAAGGLAGEFHFVTDQSCLDLFARDLSSAIGDVG
jgi:hypothetical protein